MAVESVSACQRCAKGQGCGAGIFNQGQRPVQLKCYTGESVRQGQQVVIERDSEDSGWLWLVAGAYGLPTVGLIGASLLAWALVTLVNSSPSVDSVPLPVDAVIALAALAGLVGGVCIWRRIAPAAISRVEKDLCLHSARIVVSRELPLMSSSEKMNET